MLVRQNKIRNKEIRCYRADVGGLRTAGVLSLNISLVDSESVSLNCWAIFDLPLGDGDGDEEMLGDSNDPVGLISKESKVHSTT